MPRKLLRNFLPLLFILSCPLAALAEGWDIQLNEIDSIPTSFLVVDKKSQKLHVLEKHSPLSITATYGCTTGQADGDKFLSGDLKTPEGIYFVGQKLTALDFDEYGGIAYTLNYPNPVDRLRSKSGYGIWIHGKGHDIVPKETRGCIAMNLGDLAVVGEMLSFGYPVAVGENVNTNILRDPASNNIANILKEKVSLWSQMWSGRSEKMFAMYDADSYTRAQNDESFEAFKANKQTLFKKLPWIHTIISDVKTLPGPGYWVTWFNQFYRAPNLTTEGVRRLYWQQKEGSSGQSPDDWRIVGMEWEPRDLGLSANYLENIEPGLTAFLENWRKAWEKGKVDEYASFYASNAVQGNQHGQAAIKNHKKELWRKNKPASVALNGVRIATSPAGIQADMEQLYKDSSGYQDKGIKTLILQPADGGWVIVNEDWRAMGK